jgi:UDP-glucose 4-epimerase
VTHLEARKEVLHAFADHSKLGRVFDYRARWGLADGLKRMADWARRAGPRRPTPFGEIEVEKGLPPSWRG